MKRLLLTLAAFTLALSSQAAAPWFRDAQYGLFVHWGCYSVPAKGEWYLNHSQMDPARYAAYGDQFKADKFDAREWARLIKRWGMRYIVFTTRHHDGYAMWNSKVNPFNCMKTGPKRDILGELVPALRAEGIKVGYYYSPANWSNPDYAGYCVRGWPCGASPWKDEAARKRFVAYYKAELNELLTTYGAPDYLWWDGCLPGGLEGDTLLKELRKKYPDMIWNDRMGRPCDVQSCEQEIRPAAGTCWEACMTLNHSWGYVAADNAWKTPQQVVDMLLKCTSKGGNLLINVGPKPDGTIPAPAVKVLDEAGRLLARKGLNEAMALYPDSIAWPGDNRAIRRIFDKAERGESVRIAVIGGSITEGARAGAKTNQWGEVFLRGWQTLFPKAKFEFLNAAVGATGSDLAVFRYGRDVTPFHPDLLVVEFAVNDPNVPATTVMMEALVRRAQREGASVIMLDMPRENAASAKAFHLPVAKKYGVTLVSYADAVTRRLKAGLLTWKDIAADGVHPNTRGHLLAGELMNVHVLDSWRLYREERTTKPTVPSPAVTHKYERATFVSFADVKGLTNIGFVPRKESHWGNGLVSKAIGNKVSFAFEGRSAGLLYRRGRDFGGTVRVTVDGKELKDRINPYADIWWWHTPVVIIYDGARARHTVEVEVVGAREGNAAFGLCALLVDP